MAVAMIKENPTKEEVIGSIQEAIRQIRL